MHIFRQLAGREIRGGGIRGALVLVLCKFPSPFFGAHHVLSWARARLVVLFPEPETPFFLGLARKITRARAIKNRRAFALKRENSFEWRSIAARAAQKPGFCWAKSRFLR